MAKNKIAFAGFMGAILMSVGAANAATTTTTIATKSYVDNLVGNAGNGLIKDVADLKVNAATKAELDGYELLSNKANSLTLTEEQDPNQMYPTVAAVKKALPDLTEGQIATLQGLADSGLTDVQGKSTADYQIGMKDGKWQTLSDAEKATLQSGITQTIVEQLVGGEGKSGLIDDVKGLQDAVNGTDSESGLVKDVADLQDTVSNATDGLVKKVETLETTVQGNTLPTKPDECASGNGCVLHTGTGGELTWMPVTPDNPESAQ